MAVIDLSQLPAPQIVDVPDFETLLAERKAEFVALHPKDEQEAVIRTLELESEPVTKLLQENAYRELLLRQRINEAAQAVMVAYAMGGDLDQLAANYNVTRLTVTPADNDAVPPVAAVMESDEALRLRVPAAFEGLSVAGPTAAYEFHARSADGRVADASATSPAPADQKSRCRFAPVGAPVVLNPVAADYSSVPPLVTLHCVHDAACVLFRTTSARGEASSTRCTPSTCRAAKMALRRISRPRRV